MTDLTENEKNNIIQSLANDSSSEFHNEFYNEKIMILHTDQCIFCNVTGNKYTIFNKLLSFNCFCSILCKISFESIISNIYDYNYPYSLIPYNLYDNKDDYFYLKQYLQDNIFGYEKFKLFTEFIDDIMLLNVSFITKNTIVKHEQFKLKILTKSTECLYCGNKSIIHPITCKPLTITGCCSIVCKYIFENYIINTLKPISHTKSKLLPFQLVNNDLKFIDIYKNHKHNKNIIISSSLRYDRLHVTITELVCKINDL